MNIEPSIAVVVAATLIFYLRLIILQREKAKRTAQAFAEAQQAGKNKKKRTQSGQAPGPSYSILSTRHSDLIIAGLGLLAILTGILINRGLLPAESLQMYWWIPTSAGIVAFSWAFRL